MEIIEMGSPGGIKVSELKKRVGMKDEEKAQTGGGGEDICSDVIVIERADNGHILRVMTAATETEQTFVYKDRSELLRDIAKYL